MAYITLQKKLKKNYSSGNRKIPITLDQFKMFFDEIVLSYDRSFDFIPKESRTKEYICNNFKKAHIELSKTQASEEIGIACILFLKGRRQEIRVYISPLDLWVVPIYEDFYQKYFAEAKAGDLLIITQPEAFLIKDLEDVLFNGIKDTDWDLIVGEGEFVTLIEKAKIGNMHFAKVLHKRTIYWLFGGFFAYTHDMSKEANHHLI